MGNGAEAVAAADMTPRNTIGTTGDDGIEGSKGIEAGKGNGSEAVQGDMGGGKDGEQGSGAAAEEVDNKGESKETGEDARKEGGKDDNEEGGGDEGGDEKVPTAERSFGASLVLVARHNRDAFTKETKWLEGLTKEEIAAGTAHYDVDLDNGGGASVSCKLTAREVGAFTIAEASYKCT